MLRKLLVLSAVGLGLAGCGGAPPKEAAAETAHRLFAAALRHDGAAFEAQIDRPALRADVRRQVNAMAQATSLEVDGGPSEFALDRMIGPDAVDLVRADTGAALKAPPTAAELASQMTVVDRQHVCLRNPGPTGACLLTFAERRDRWRLVGMKAMGLRIEVAGAD